MRFPSRTRESPHFPASTRPIVKHILRTSSGVLGGRFCARKLPPVLEAVFRLETAFTFAGSFSASRSEPSAVFSGGCFLADQQQFRAEKLAGIFRPIPSRSRSARRSALVDRFGSLCGPFRSRSRCIVPFNPQRHRPLMMTSERRACRLDACLASLPAGPPAPRPIQTTSRS
jgi:hypothetical protein